MTPETVRDILKALGREVRADDASVVLYHAASLEGAEWVVTSGRLTTKESVDGAYVSSSPAIVSLRGPWEVVVAVRVRVDDLVVSSDERENDDPEIRRVDFVLPVKDGTYEPIAVGRAAYDSAGAPTGPMPPDWDI